jgi:hypothetical protein
MNRSVVLLKKQFSELKGVQHIDKADIFSAKQLLAVIVLKIINEFGENSSFVQQDDKYAQIPPLFLKRLQDKHKNDMEWYVEDLRKLYRVLIEDSTWKEFNLNPKIYPEWETKTVNILKSLLDSPAY